MEACMHTLSSVVRLLEPLSSTLSRLSLTLVAVTLTAPLGLAHAQSVNHDTPAPLTSVRAQLIGSWRLISRESHRENGELEGDPGLSIVPMGMLIYDQSGHVAAQLSRRD